MTDYFGDSQKRNLIFAGKKMHFEISHIESRKEIRKVLHITYFSWFLGFEKKQYYSMKTEIKRFVKNVANLFKKAMKDFHDNAENLDSFG